MIQKLKESEKERIDKLEEFERKANVQLERQLVIASEWSRKLLTMRGKLKGTEWDPETSHTINYSDFRRLLDSNNVQFMEYANYGQTVSGGIFSLNMFLMKFICLCPYLTSNFCSHVNKCNANGRTNGS